jgi:hypothetical protein
MDRHSNDIPPHFHIRWKGKGSLDWECFETHSGATTRALELAQPNEEFTIEEVFAKCPLREQKAASAG